ncbi:MAG: Uma2 family endonuclease [Methylococcaceae bacterium]|nr:MAG: Uma2 family endonuclease [Methylococcaceae bacterium]
MHAETLKAVEKLNLPFPWETNARGQIIMTPVNYNHSNHVMRLARMLALIAPEWESGTELGIITSDGIKAPDLILAGPAYHAEHQNRDGYVTQAPEICVEVMSPFNSWAEMLDKMPLYFETGAQEVWIVDTDGKVAFYAPGRTQLNNSRLIPAAPVQL